MFLYYTRFDIPVEDDVLPDAVFAGTFGSETAARASRIRADGVVTLEGLALRVEGRRGSGRVRGAGFVELWLLGALRGDILVVVVLGFESVVVSVGLDRGAEITGIKTGSMVGVGAGVAFTGGIGVGTLSTSTSSNSSSDNVEPVLDAKGGEGGSLSNEDVSFVESNLVVVLV